MSFAWHLDRMIGQDLGMLRSAVASKELNREFDYYLSLVCLSYLFGASFINC